MAEEFGRALDWEDEIEKDSAFSLLEPGDYNFTVTAFERSSYAGNLDRGGKICPCNQAVLTIRVCDNAGNESMWKEGFILHSSLEWKVSEIHRALGLKKHGEKLRMKWKEMPGLGGRCKVKVREYTKNDGSKGQANQVERYYDPEPQGATATAPKAPQAVQGSVFAPKR